MSGSDLGVSCFERYIATWRGRATSRARRAEVISSDSLRGVVGSGPHDLDASDDAALRVFIRDHHAVVSALPFHLNKEVARICAEERRSYFDFTEDTATTRLAHRAALHEHNAPHAIAAHEGVDLTEVLFVFVGVCGHHKELANALIRRECRHHAVDPHFFFRVHDHFLR